MVKDTHNLNVALTRARLGLIVICDRKTLRYDATWNAFIEDCETRNIVVGAQPRVKLPASASRGNQSGYFGHVLSYLSGSRVASSQSGHHGNEPGYLGYPPDHLSAQQLASQSAHQMYYRGPPAAPNQMQQQTAAGLRSDFSAWLQSLRAQSSAEGAVPSAAQDFQKAEWERNSAQTNTQGRVPSHIEFVDHMWGA